MFGGGFLFDYVDGVFYEEDDAGGHEDVVAEAEGELAD